MKKKKGESGTQLSCFAVCKVLCREKALLGSLHALKIFCAIHRELKIFCATHREEGDIYSSYLLSQINKPCSGFFAFLLSTMFTFALCML